MELRVSNGYIQYLNYIRAAELDKIVSWFRPGARILEVGAGTGRQALELTDRGFDVSAIDIPESQYVGTRLFPINDYDGRSIPFPDASFDVVFSSNVLEHVQDLSRIHAETHRVLRPEGYAVHVLPTHIWRFWTTIAAFPAALQNINAVKRELIPSMPHSSQELRRLGHAWYRAARHCVAPFVLRRHGERGTAISELWLFHPGWWRRNFCDNGFEIVRDEPIGLFYTGQMLLGTKWSLDGRARIAALLGSSCHAFAIRARRYA